MSRLLQLLLLSSLLTSASRLWLLARGPGTWWPQPLPAPPGLVLRLFVADRVPVAPASYQLAALVQHQAPAFQLRARRILAVEGGDVAIGTTPAGAPALQTCLMPTQVSAFTYEQMHRQLLQTAPQAWPARLRSVLAALLLGTPWRDRTCRLVLLQAQPGQPLHLAQDQLLRTWQTIRPLLPQPGIP